MVRKAGTFPGKGTCCHTLEIANILSKCSYRQDCLPVRGKRGVHAPSCTAHDTTCLHLDMLVWHLECWIGALMVFLPWPFYAIPKGNLQCTVKQWRTRKGRGARIPPPQEILNEEDKAWQSHWSGNFLLFLFVWTRPSHGMKYHVHHCSQVVNTISACAFRV